MKKLQAWKTALRQEVFGLNPFAFQHRAEQKQRSAFSSANFTEEVNRQLGHLPAKLSKMTIAYLYERCLQAWVEKETITVASKIVKNKRWGSARRRVPKLLDSLAHYMKNDPERALRTLLREALDRSTYESRSTTRLAVVKLRDDLKQLGRLDLQWRRFQSYSSWEGLYRDALVAMDKHLRRQSRYSQAQRAEVIAACISAFKLKPDRPGRPIDADSIYKLLYRVKSGKTKTHLRFVD